MALESVHTSAQPPGGVGTIFIAVATCLLGAACQPTPSGSEGDGQSDVDGPHECEVDEDCAPDEVCVQDYGKVCESSCEAREPDLDVCGCAEGQYCEPGESCPAIGCAGGQLCSSGECREVSLAADCDQPTYWSLNTTVVEAGSEVVAIRLAHLTLGGTPELVLLRPKSIQKRNGTVWTRPELDDPTMIRAANIAGETGQLLVASSSQAWLYAGVPGPEGTLQGIELRESFALDNLVDAQLGDFGGGPELDVWLLGASEGVLYLGDEASGFAEPLSFDQLGPDSASTIGDLDLDGRADLARGAEIWLGAEAPAWAAPSLTLEPPAWLGASASAQALAIPEGLAIAWTVPASRASLERYTTIASYLALDSGAETPSVETVLYPGRPDQLIGSAGPIDDGWLAIEGDAIVVYRELADQHCRAVTQGTGTYVEGQLESPMERLFLLTTDGAVEEWLRI